MFRGYRMRLRISTNQGSILFWGVSPCLLIIAGLGNGLGFLDCIGGSHMVDFFIEITRNR